jgi:hypothetical protein
MTLTQILANSSAFLDLDPSLPTSTELLTRVNFANQSVNEAASASALKEFHTIQVVQTGSTASISLLSNFREFMAPPQLLLSNGTYQPYAVIYPLERFEKDPQDFYCYVIGNPMEGYTAVFNNLISGCMLAMDYQRYPSGLATLTDVCELPDPNYAVTKVESYVLQSRSDDRFPTLEAKALNQLQNMIGRNMQMNGRENTTPRTQMGSYRIGT